MRRRHLAIVTSGLLLLGACGSEPRDTSGPAAGPDDPVSSTPAPQDPPASDGQGGRVEPDPSAIEARPSSFEKAKVLDERTVRVFFYQGVPPCSLLQRVDVEYGTKTIGVTLYVGRAATNEDVACIELAVRNHVDVELDEPIDGRKIVDGAV